MRNSTPTRTLSRLVWLRSVVAIAIVFGIACGTDKSQVTDRGAGTGTIAVLRAPRSASDRGDLVLLSLPDLTARTVLTQASEQGFPNGRGVGGSILSVTLLDVPPSIVRIDTSSGDILPIAAGGAPAASGDGRIAYTDSDGRLTIRRVDASGTPIVVGKFAVSGVYATWSYDGRLAFVATPPAGTADPTVSVVIVAQDGSRAELPVEGRHFGSHSIAWSPNGGQLAVGLSPNEVRVIDSTNGATLQHYDGVDGRFSPAGDATIAVLIYDSSSGSKAARLNLYHYGDLVVSHDLGHLSRPAFDWSPDGTRIVTAMDDSIGIWNIADNTFQTFRVTSGDQKIFGDVLWIST